MDFDYEKQKQTTRVFDPNPKQFDNAWRVGLVNGSEYWGLRMGFLLKSICFYGFFV
jgi:hypothetical protein